MCSFAATLGFGVVFFIYATTLTLQAGVAVTTAALRAKNAFLKADCFDDIQKLDAVFKEYPRISIYDDFVAQNPNRVILDDIETLNNPASNILRLQELMDIYLPYNESGMYDEIVPVFNKMLSLDFKTEYFREFSEQVKQYDTGCSDFAKQLDPKTDIQKEINDSYLSITGYIGIALTTIAFFAAPV
jgi:hypothetical protein